MQRLVRGLRQWMHSPHSGANSVTTWSPGRTSVTPSPTRLDDARALVAEHAGRVAGRVGAGCGVEVGVADAAGDEAHEHLAGLRFGELELLDDEGLAEFLEDGGTDLHSGIVRVKTVLGVPRLRGDVDQGAPPRARGIERPAG